MKGLEISYIGAYQTVRYKDMRIMKGLEISHGNKIYAETMSLGVNNFTGILKVFPRFSHGKNPFWELFTPSVCIICLCDLLLQKYL
mgnify:CR=1 FL=1